MNNQNFNEIQERSLDKCYFCIYCLSSKIHIGKENDKIDEKEIYTFFGLDLYGKRKFITTILVDDYNNTNDYYELFQKIKTRSTEKVLYLIAPRNDNLKKAIKLSFPDIEFVLSCFAPFYKINNYVSKKYFENIFSDIKNVFLSEDDDIYKNNMLMFNDKYDTSSFIIDLISKNLNEAKNYFIYDIKIRKVLFAYYFHRETIMRLTAIKNSQPSFNNLNEYINLCIPLFQKIELKMFCTKKEWINIIDTVYLTKKEQLLPYL